MASRSRVVRALVEADEAYVAALSTMLATYRSQATAVGLSKEVSERLFRHSEAITKLQMDFLTALKERILSWDDSKSKVCDVFVGSSALWEAVQSYSASHDLAILTLEQILADTTAHNPYEQFQQLHKQESSVSSVSLAVLLSLPLDRVGSYLLSLNALAQDTPADHSDHADGLKAVALLTAVKDAIQENTSSSQNRRWLREVRADLSQQNPGDVLDNLLRDSRTLLKKGSVVVEPSSTPCVLYVFNDVIVFTVEGKITEQLKIDADLAVVKKPDEIRLKLSRPDAARDVTLCTTGLAQKEEWFSLLSHLRTGVFFSEPRCPLCKSFFTLSRLTHHCRDCGTSMCSSCATFEVTSSQLSSKPSSARPSQVAVVVSSSSSSAASSVAAVSEGAWVCVECTKSPLALDGEDFLREKVAEYELENQKFAAEVRDKEAKIQQLRLQVVQLASRVDLVSTEKDEMRREFELELDEYDRKKGLSDEDVALIRETVVQQTKAYKQKKDKEIAKLKAEIELLRQELPHHSNNAPSSPRSSSEVEALKADNAKLRVELDKANKKIEKVVGKAEKQLAALIEENDQLKLKYKHELTQTQITHTQDIQMRDTEIAQLRSRVDELERSMEGQRGEGDKGGGGLTVNGGDLYQWAGARSSVSSRRISASANGPSTTINSSTAYHHPHGVPASPSSPLTSPGSPKDAGKQKSMTNGGPSLREGFLMKKSGGVMKRWQRRWCKLTAQELTYWKQDKQQMQIKGVIKLTDILSVKAVDPADGQADNHQFCFCLLLNKSTTDRTYFFHAESGVELRGWMESLNKGMQLAASSGGGDRSGSMTMSNE